MGNGGAPMQRFVSEIEQHPCPERFTDFPQRKREFPVRYVATARQRAPEHHHEYLIGKILKACDGEISR